MKMKRCKCCGRMFYPVPKNTLYCSQECKAEAHRISNREWKKKMWAQKKMELLKQINAMGKESTKEKNRDQRIQSF